MKSFKWSNSLGPRLGLFTGDAWITVCFTGSVNFKSLLGLWEWVEPDRQLVRILSIVNVNKFGCRLDQLKCYLGNLSFKSVNTNVTPSGIRIISHWGANPAAYHVATLGDTHTHTTHTETCVITEEFEVESFPLRYNPTISECKIHFVEVNLY